MSTGLTIGFVGTGIMGGHMARRLAQAGHRVTAWNRTSEKALALNRHGVALTAHAADVAREADVVICMLSSGPVCDEILLDLHGVLTAMPQGATLIVMSSIPVASARHQAVAAAERGVAYLDAPVSGGEPGAEAGTLAIMVGGEEHIAERMRPVFEAMGRPVRVGPTGSGQLCKLVNQVLVASTIAATAEALVLAERGGADPAKVREALMGGFADSTVLKLHAQRMITGDFVPGGPAKYQVKDTNTAVALSRGMGLELPLLTMVDRLFADMVSHGDGDLDHSAIIREIRRRQT